ncbi:MAG: gamma-glutamyl-gamma-aminobutyrate hydrolase family protein [Candidatus Bathyarchaeia archaeon]|jgi:GMP synthase (glutamine-hydrolysing)
MSKTLIVNCSLKATQNEALLKAVGKFSECKVVPFGNIQSEFQVDKNVDAVVLSGSAARIVSSSDRELFQATINLIKTCYVPIFGICFGHQLLCWTFGAKVETLNQSVLDRFESVRIVEADDLFAGFTKSQTATLAESHYDYVLKESLKDAGFDLLADSESCEVEAVKHRRNPFYGVQFHPERINVQGESQLDGYRIIENFYGNVVKR